MRARAGGFLLALAAVVACGCGPAGGPALSSTAPSFTGAATTAPAQPSSVPASPTAAAVAGTTTTATPTTPTTPTTPATPTTVSASTAAPTTAVTTTTAPPAEPGRAFPVQDAASSGFADEHHDYPAADIFSPGGCGSPIVAPVDGVVLELRRTDLWTQAVDDPADRGGIYVSILGNDGVRYYMAHFSSLEPFLQPGAAVAAGQLVGAMGRTGRAGACHLHFALSPPCPTDDWWVRRGVIWPQVYLRDWQRGGNLSPAAEVAAWPAANPQACTTPATD